MCITVNNLEHVSKHLKPLTSQLSLASSCGSQDSQDAFEAQGEKANIIDDTLTKIDSLIYKVLAKVAQQLEPGLKKHVFHLAWSPDTLPTEEAICPLTTFLTENLTKLHACLLAGNFLRCLHVVWDQVLSQLGTHTDIANGEKMPLFYDRLQEALQILSDYFMCDGRGLDGERLFCQTYRDMDLLLGLARLSSQQLIVEYYRERLAEQFNITVPEFGVLEVRVYFRHDTLCVEVFSAKDVIPLDPNGLSDPYVIVELLPKWTFPNIQERSTAVQKATLNPQFEETFEFSCHREQCRDPEAVICFTLMDYDVITANDFGGEAFLALQSVSGVEMGSSSVDNFHGLKPHYLPLMFQKQKNHPILKTLEARASDKFAQDFLKRQKERIQE